MISCSHLMRQQRLVILTLITFKYFALIKSNAKQYWLSNCQENYEFCPFCFDKHDDSNQDSSETFQCCDKVFQHIEFGPEAYETSIDSMFGSRNLQPALWSTQKQVRLNVILKYLSSDDDKVHRTKNAFCNYARDNFTSENDCDIIWKQFMISANNRQTFVSTLRHLYHANQWTDGLALCPSQSNDKFIETFNQFSDGATFWLQLMTNPELVVLKAVERFSADNNLSRFTPSVIDWCGFLIIEKNAGYALYEFYGHSFHDRIKLAQQILEAAIAFSHGINGFRIYLTDATPDNIVVDRETLQVAFVDLDSLQLVDSSAFPVESKIHRHEKIDCDRCFAYVPDELCSHRLSDINLFSVCQIFTENLFYGTMEGLLHSIPTNSPEGSVLADWLDECVQCDKMENCTNRFDVANRLLQIFGELLLIG